MRVKSLSSIVGWIDNVKNSSLSNLFRTMSASNQRVQELKGVPRQDWHVEQSG